MASNKAPQRKPDFDIEELNKCTLCNFRTHIKSMFQRHLINRHGIKLKGFEGFVRFGRMRGQGPALTPVGYGVDKDIKKIDNDIKKIDNTVICPKCNLVCGDMKYYQSHVKVCGTVTLHKCPRCPLSFSKVARLNKHLQICSREVDVLCQLCEFRCLALDKMISHYLRRHNLICTMVKEPDFDEALSGAPYILERPMELEELPSKTEVAIVGDATLVQTEEKTIPVRHVNFNLSTKKRKFFSCNICKKEFTKLKFMNRHAKRGCS